MEAEVIQWQAAFADCCIEGRPVSVFKHPLFPGMRFIMNERNTPERQDAYNRVFPQREMFEKPSIARTTRIIG